MSKSGSGREPFRIAFFGLPIAALLLREDGHEIVQAAICRDDALGLRRLSRALPPDAFSVKPRIDAAYVARTRALSPDLVVSWFWTKRLPPSILKASRLGALGVHPSLLPRHRGPDPYFWTIDHGDALTGVSAHWLEAEYDTGAVIAQRSLDVSPSWNAWDLAKALDRPSLALLRDVVRRLAAGEPLPGSLQDEGNATSAPAPTDDELEIDWNWTCAQIVRRVRAAASAPGAYTDLAGHEFVILEAAIAPMSRALAALAPGEMTILDGAAVIRASDGGVIVQRAQLGDADAETGPRLRSTLAAFSTNAGDEVAFE
ncbi:MAG: formyltransferase family protein [Polyangiaceae bacterium]